MDSSRHSPAQSLAQLLLGLRYRLYPLLQRVSTAHPCRSRPSVVQVSVAAFVQLAADCDSSAVGAHGRSLQEAGFQWH
jgi:hypothetical protein